MHRMQRLVDPELQREWLAALRSGKYRQHKGSLASPYYRTFCCQGVACEIAPGIERNEGGKYHMKYSNSMLEFRYTWPVSLLDKLGLTGGQGTTLAGMNDGGDPFSEIADAAVRFMKMNGTYYGGEERDRWIKLNHG